MAKGIIPKTDKAFKGVFDYLEQHPEATAFVNKEKKSWFFNKQTALKHFGEGNFIAVPGESVDQEAEITEAEVVE